MTFLRVITKLTPSLCWSNEDDNFELRIKRSSTFRSRTKRITSWDRPKSAPYLRLKNSKRGLKCRSILSYSTRQNGGPFGIFQYPFCRKTPKKMKGDDLGNIFFLKKSRNAENNLRGTLWSRPVLYVTRETFIFGSVPWGNRGNLKLCRTFGRTILVISGKSKNKSKNTDEKPWL